MRDGDMKIIDKELLREFAGKTRCELCKKALRHAAHPHHIYSRGAGRLDIAENLVALGGPWDCGCHGLFHGGRIMLDDLLAVAAVREGCLQTEITAYVHLLRRTAKGQPMPPRLKTVGSICSSPVLKTVLRVFWCSTCKRRRFHTVSFFEWYSPIARCRKCGESWTMEEE